MYIAYFEIVNINSNKNRSLPINQIDTDQLGAILTQSVTQFWQNASMSSSISNDSRRINTSLLAPLPGQTLILTLHTCGFRCFQNGGIGRHVGFSGHIDFIYSIECQIWLFHSLFNGFRHLIHLSWFLISKDNEIYIFQNGVGGHFEIIAEIGISVWIRGLICLFSKSACFFTPDQYVFTS